MNRSRPPAVGELINVNAPCDLTIIIGGAFYRAVPDAVPVGVRGPGCSPSPASVGDLTAPRPDESKIKNNENPRLEAKPAEVSCRSRTAENGTTGAYAPYLNGLLRTWRQWRSHLNTCSRRGNGSHWLRWSSGLFRFVGPNAPRYGVRITLSKRLRDFDVVRKTGFHGGRLS